MQRKKNKLIQENILHSTFRHFFLKHTLHLKCLQIFFHRSCEIKYFSTGFEENPCPFIYWLKLNAISHTWSTSTSWYLLKRVKIPRSLINSLGCQKNERGQNCPSRGTDRQMYRHRVDTCCTHRHGAPCLLCVSGISNSKANLACMKKEHLKNTRLCQLNVKIYVPKEWVLSALQTERFPCSLTGINGLQRTTGGSKDIDSTDSVNGSWWKKSTGCWVVCKGTASLGPRDKGAWVLMCCLVTTCPVWLLWCLRWAFGTTALV